MGRKRLEGALKANILVARPCHKIRYSYKGFPSYTTVARRYTARLALARQIHSSKEVEFVVALAPFQRSEHSWRI
jgi:hypothetical protein